MKDINILKENGIAVDQAIEILGDIEMYEETLKDFLEEIDARLERIKQTQQNSDMENYAIEVHALKGDSNYLGFTWLASMALEHQLKSQENDIDYINNHKDELIEETTRIIEVIKQYFS